MNTGDLARKLIKYYKGARRIFRYGRWQSMAWAIKMAKLDIQGDDR